MFPSFFFHDDLFIYIYITRNLYYRTHGRVLWYRDSLMKKMKRKCAVITRCHRTDGTI